MACQQYTPTPTLLRYLDEQALAIDTAAGGGVALLTNQTTGEADTGAVFAGYKGQDAVEHRHGAFKGYSPSPHCSWRTTPGSAGCSTPSASHC